MEKVASCRTGLADNFLSTCLFVSHHETVCAHTPRVQLSVYHISAIWRSELGWGTPSRYLAISWNTCKLLLLLL